MNYELKTDPDLFNLVKIGVKRYEVRYDRGYNPGDRLLLRETKHSGEGMKNGLPLLYTGRHLFAVVTHVLDGYGIMDGWVILSIDIVDDE